jgi:hypothetical protein
MPLNPFNLHICNQCVNTQTAVFNYYIANIQLTTSKTTEDYT